MNKSIHIICSLLFIILLVPIAQAQESNVQETNAQEDEPIAQESELREAMIRWLREQKELMITPDFQTPQQPQQLLRNFSPIQPQAQQETIRRFPSAHFPNYLIGTQTTPSYEEMLLQNMMRNLGNMSLSNLPPVSPTRAQPDRIGIHNIMNGGSAIVTGDFCIVRALERRRLRRNAEQVDRLGIPRLPTRLDIIEMDEIIERTNQIFREAKEERRRLEIFDN